jgi:anti-sigma factor RsiW
MMCDEMKMKLEAYADGQARPAEARETQAHLDSCAECRATLKWIVASKAAVRSRALPPLPADLKANLLAEARRVQAARRPGPFEGILRFWRERPWQVGLAFAGAAAAVMLAARLSGGRAEVVTLDAMLAAHNEYERTMPLSSQEQLLSVLPSQMSEGGSGR